MKDILQIESNPICFAAPKAFGQSGQSDDSNLRSDVSKSNNSGRKVAAGSCNANRGMSFNSGSRNSFGSRFILFSTIVRSYKSCDSTSGVGSVRLPLVDRIDKICFFFSLIFKFRKMSTSFFLHKSIHNEVEISAIVFVTLQVQFVFDS